MTLPDDFDLERLTELRVFQFGGYRAIVDGTGGWGNTQREAIENAIKNAKRLRRGSE